MIAGISASGNRSEHRKPLTRIGPAPQSGKTGPFQQGHEIVRAPLVGIFGVDTLAASEAALALFFRHDRRGGRLGGVRHPVSSPVNTLVMAPGGYRFNDCVRVGLPLMLILLVITVLVVPWLLPR